MKRFFGMMPYDEIQMEKHYRTDLGVVTIQAGVNGWTVIFADGGTIFKDEVNTVQANFKTAYDRLLEIVPKGVDEA